MLNQNFSPDNLKKFLHSRRDQRKLKKQNSFESEEKILTDLSYKVDSQDFKFESISTAQIKNKKIVRTKSIKEILILRKLNDNLKRIYGAKQSNRREITKQVYTLLQEINPIHIIRLDIKSFYESIKLDAVLEPIFEETLLSPTSKKIVKAILRDPSIPDHIPRGLNISSTLTEIYMRDFDSAIRSLSGGYYYARYVDDIIIFAYKNITTGSERAIKSSLPTGLNTHKKKSKYHPIICRCLLNCECSNNCKCRASCTCEPDAPKNITLDYLGYNFTFSDIPKNSKKEDRKKPKKINVSLAERKVNRIKTRTILALLDHCKKPNYQLLKDRIHFLTGNCEFSIKGDFKIRSGIFYNYPLLSADDPALLDLTNFLRKSVHSKRGSLGRALSKSLSNAERSQLGRLSFRSGFKNKITYKVSEEKLSAIKECWKNA